MNLSYVDLLGDGERHEIAATITTEHPLSSYGQPVILLDDGAPLDMTSWILLGYQVVKASPKEVELLKKVLSMIALLTDTSNAGRKLGTVKSAKKAKSSANNGRLGGRPKQKGNDAH